jgi:hypothetical protein
VISTFDPFSAFGLDVEGVPVPVPVAVPVPDTPWNITRSISDPLLATIPCKFTAVLLAPNASVKVTEIVQSGFSTYVPTVAVNPPCGVMVPRILPEPSKKSVPGVAKGAVPLKPPNSVPTSEFVNAEVVVVEPVPVPVPVPVLVPVTLAPAPMAE